MTFECTHILELCTYSIREHDMLWLHLSRSLCLYFSLSLTHTYIQTHTWSQVITYTLHQFFSLPSRSNRYKRHTRVLNVHWIVITKAFFCQRTNLCFIVSVDYLHTLCFHSKYITKQMTKRNHGYGNHPRLSLINEGSEYQRSSQTLTRCTVYQFRSDSLQYREF